MSIASQISRIQTNITNSFTAVAGKGVPIPAGSNSDDLPDLIEQIVQGAGSAIVVTEEEDAHGGVIKRITAVDLSDDTVRPGVLLQGYTAHNRLGQPVAGTATSTASPAALQRKTVTPMTVSQTVTPDTGYDGLEQVTVSGYTQFEPSGTINITENGTVNVREYLNANVSVEPDLQTKTVEPSDTSQLVTADENYDGLATVLVNAIPSEYVIPTGTISVTENGTTDVSGYASASISVVPNMQSKTITPTTSQQSVSPDSGYDGLSGVTVNAIPSQYIIPSGTKTITQNGTTDVSNYASAQVNVTQSLQSKTNINPSASSQTITPDSGYDGLSSVQINAIANGSAATPATTITTNPTISVNSTTGVITASVAGSESITPTVVAGYVSSGTSGTVSVSGSNTSNLSVQEAKTVTPTEAEQTAVAANKYTLGVVKVAAIPDTYIGSAITVDPTPTVSGATVNIPGGYYSEDTSKSVTTATHSDPSVSVNTTTGLITATHTQTAGYVSAGTTTGTTQLSIQLGTTITPAETEQTAVAANKYTTGVVKVAAISSTYVGSDITQRDETDLTASGATVTVPAGYYAESESKSVASGSATTPATSITANPAISVDASGLITATASATKSVTPTVSAGYVSSGTAGTITVSGSNTSQLSTQAAVTATPTEQEQTIVSAGKYTTGAIKVAAIDSEYVGSDIPRKDSTDLTASGATVSVPAGYYEETASKTVASGSAATPATSITANPTIAISAAGLITATASGSKSITPTVSAGYVSAGTAGTVSVSGSNTEQLTTQAAKTVTPTETEQTAVAAGVYTTGAVKVAAISSTYVGSGITSRDETDLTASGAMVTVPAGYYAEQEIKSVATVTQASPTVSVNTTTGLITATHTQSAGYVAAGTKTGTSQLSTQAAATITPTEEEQVAVAANKYTLGQVKVAAISNTYVGSGITSRSSTDLTASGATVTVPAGYYADQASKSVATMTLPTAVASSATSGYTSKATIGRSTSNQYINIPAGYNSAGGYYTISAVPNGTVTAPASISGTAATVSTGTNTVTLTKTVSVTPNVSTAGYISAGTAGNSSVSLTASVTTKAAATITPTKSTQTIASGTYLTGTQTIAAIPAAYQDVTSVTAAAGDVVSGKSIVDASGNVVNGSLVIQHYYTGSSAPSSSTGVNGDIYLQT